MEDVRDASWVPEAPAVPEPEAYDAEALAFVSGEAAQYDPSAKTLLVRIFLDEEGNMSDQTLLVRVTSDTEITDGEESLDAGALSRRAEVDVEYKKENNTATYIFIYS